MGLFGKHNVPVNLGDRVWISKQKKYDNLLTDAENYIRDGKAVMIAWFFTDTCTLIKKMLEEKNIPFSDMDNVRPDIEQKINMVEAELFKTKYFIDRISMGEQEGVILFAEHFPLFSVEESIFKSMEPLGKRLSYTFYLSFDEPLLARFGAGNIIEVLAKLGMDKDEMISHTMISAAIKNVQKKIEASVKFEIRSFSMEAWFENNLREKPE
jgi:preprotein translocase subunit SecA